jgi:hypothetical protein
MNTPIRFASPLGILGRSWRCWCLRRYATHFLERRTAMIKRVAESEEWREFCPKERTEHKR